MTLKSLSILSCCLALARCMAFDTDPDQGGPALTPAQIAKLSRTVISIRVEQTHRVALGVVVRATGMALVPAEAFSNGLATRTSSGQVIPNYVSQATIAVVLHDGAAVAARLVNIDPRTGLAAIQLALPPDARLAAVEPIDELRIAPGQKAAVIAQGRKPMEAVFTGSVAVGIDSATRQYLPLVEFHVQELATGLGGAAIFTMDGKFAGMVRAQETAGTVIINRPQATWFALSGKLVARVADGFSKEPFKVRHRWIGVECQSAANAQGAVVGRIAFNGPGQAAGLFPGDVIIAAGGKVIRSAADLAAVVFDQDEGALIEIKVLRNRLPITTRLKVAVQESPP